MDTDSCWRSDCDRRPVRRVTFARDGTRAKSCWYHFRLLLKGRTHVTIEAL